MQGDTRWNQLPDIKWCFKCTRDTYVPTIDIAKITYVKFCPLSLVLTPNEKTFQGNFWQSHFNLAVTPTILRSEQQGKLKLVYHGPLPLVKRQKVVEVCKIIHRVKSDYLNPKGARVRQLCRREKSQGIETGLIGSGNGKLLILTTCKDVYHAHDMGEWRIIRVVRSINSSHDRREWIQLNYIDLLVSFAVKNFDYLGYGLC